MNRLFENEDCIFYRGNNFLSMSWQIICLIILLIIQVTLLVIYPFYKLNKIMNEEP